MSKTIRQQTEQTTWAETDMMELETSGNLPRSIQKTNMRKNFFASPSQGDLLYYNGTDWVRLAAGTAGQVLQTLGASANPAWVNVELYNYLINGGFSIAQRQVPGTLTTYAANTYSADRWKTYAENASYQFARQDGLGETGLTCQFFGAFKKITNTGKMFIYQILEGRESAALRGKTVIFQCQMKASAAKTIRMGVFELQTAGTIDSVPSPIVTSAGANSTDPTMGTNVAVITAAQSKSVTTSMQTFSVSVTVPSNSKNLICAVWTDSQFAANDILYIAEAGLYVSAFVQPWKPRLSQQEIALCQRYARRPFEIDGTNNIVIFTAFRYSTNLIIGGFSFPPMRGTPVAEINNISAWSATAAPTTTEAGAFDYNGGAAVTITGALTPTIDQLAPTQARFLFGAGTSFSGSSADICDIRLGPNVIIVLSAEL